MDISHLQDHKKVSKVVYRYQTHHFSQSCKIRNHKIIQILCIGETKTLLDNNTYLDLIKNQLEIVKQNAIRQKYVDQAISLNLCFDPNDTPKWISQVHKEAHIAGIKTLYYLRTESVLRGDNLQRLSECISCEGQAK